MTKLAVLREYVVLPKTTIRKKQKGLWIWISQTVAESGLCWTLEDSILACLLVSFHFLHKGKMEIFF